MDWVFGFVAIKEDGTQDLDFNALDNDYIRMYMVNWDNGLNKEEERPAFHLREGPELEICKPDRVDKL